MNQEIERLASRIAEELARAAAEASRKTAERLNEASRRLRQCRSEEEVYGILSESAARFSECTLLLRIGEGIARVRLAGGSEAEFALDLAPAVAAAASSGDPVVAIGSPAEVPALVLDGLGLTAGRTVCLQPVCLQGRTVAVLCALPGETAALELLASLAGTALERLESASRMAGPLRIGTAREAADSAGGDQPIEVRARRFARVRTAEIRLRRPGAVVRGRAAGDLYTRLRPEIDAARQDFQRQFLARCPSMPDYLHEEVVRTLANHRPASLGAEYPGPLTS